MILQQLKKHISNVEDYENLFEDIQQFLKKEHLTLSEDIEVTFWNHIGSLFQRLEESEQNTLEIPKEHGIDDEAFQLTDELVETIIKPKFGSKVSDFEKFLIALYFQNMREKKGGDHE